MSKSLEQVAEEAEDEIVRELLSEGIERITFAEARAINLGVLNALRSVVREFAKVKTLGHNEDCLFCGFKDKELTTLLKKYGVEE